VQARTLGASRIEIRVTPSLAEGQPPPVIDDADHVQLSADRHTIVVAARHPARTLVELVKWIDQHGLELVDVQLKRPSLEDVFIELTGKTLRE
jgi:ABC-2 type transport system ATP-binding protein